MSRPVVFDLFHTLVDPEDFGPCRANRVAEAAAALGADEDAFARYWWETRRERSVSNVRAPRNYLQAFASAHGLALDEEAYARCEARLGAYQSQALLAPRRETLEGLTALRAMGAPLGLLSNADACDVRAWEASPLRAYFDAVCFSFEIGAEKPSAEAYAAVFDALGAAPEDAVFAGDGGSNELQGAREAGVGLVVFVNGFMAHNGIRTEAELEAIARSADATVPNAAALPRLLAQRTGVLDPR